MLSRSPRMGGPRDRLSESEIEPGGDHDGVPCRVKVLTRGLALMLGVALVGLTRLSQSSPIPSVFATCHGFSSSVKALVLAADGRAIYGCMVDGTQTTWNADLSQPRVGASQGSGILKAAFTPNGSTLGVVDGDGVVSLWDMAEWRRWAEIPPRTGKFSALAFSRDSATLAIADSSGVRLWDATTADPSAGPQLDLVGTISGLAFAADGRTLAVGTMDGAVRLWDSAQGSLGAPIRAHRSYVRSMAFSEDGRMLVSSSPHDQIARLWDTDAGRLLRELDSRSLIQAVAFAPGDRGLATAGHDGAVQLWDAATGDSHWALSAGDGPVLALAFSGDGTTLACGGAGATRLYRLNASSQAASR